MKTVNPLYVIVNSDNTVVGNANDIVDARNQRNIDKAELSVKLFADYKKGR